MTRGDKRRDPLIALRIPPALDERLRAHAADTGSSLSEIVRDAIATALDPDPIIRVEPAARFKPVTHVTDERTGAKHRVRQAKPAMCEHRTRQGNYCRRCDRVV